MRIFVTGANGFLGRRLVHHLLAAGHDTYCLLRGDAEPFRASFNSHARLHTVPGTLNRVTCPDCDTIIHCASTGTGGAAALFANNVVATRHFIDQLRHLTLRRFVLISSIGVYGTSHLRPGDVVDEHCPLDPVPHRRDPYSYSKIAQEQIAWEAGIPLVVVRPAVIYGPGRGSLSARIGLRLGKWMVRMGGQQRLPYTYIDNCAAAIERAAATPDIDGQAFNIVDDNLPTAQQVLNSYRSQVAPMGIVPIPGSAIAPLSGLCEWYHQKSNGQLPAVLTRYKSEAQWKPLRYSNARAKSVLEWVPRVGIEQGLRLSNDWSREQLQLT